MASLKTRKLWDELGLYDRGGGVVGMRNVPKFRSEAEEVKWHDRTHEAVLDFALEHGLKGKRPAPGVARPTSIRLRPEDIERARKLAARRGLGYQTYLKMLLHEALEKEERAVA